MTGPHLTAGDAGPYPPWVWILFGTALLTFGVVVIIAALLGRGTINVPHEPLADGRRFCGHCAERGLIVSYPDDRSLSEHLRSRHGDS